MIVRCTLLLPRELDLTGYSADVRVEDVTMIDAPSTVVARNRTGVADLERRGLRLGPIALELDAPPASRRYVVRAEVSRRGDLAPGDLTSTVAIPLRGTGAVDVPLTLVGGRVE